MACPVLISPACIVAGKIAGAVAGTAASGALNGIAAAIESGITWMVTQTSTWWVQLPSPDLSGEPAVGQLQRWMLPLTVAVAVLGLIIAGAKMTLTRRANPLIDAGSGLAVIAATSAVGVLLPALLIKAGDAWSAWVLQAAAGGQFTQRLASVLTLGGSTPSVVVVLGIVAIIISAIQAVLMLFRQGALVVLAGVLPAGRHRDAHPGHASLVPPRHRLDARADLLQAGRGGRVCDRVHHDRHRQGPAHRADGLHDGFPCPCWRCPS